MSTRTRTPRSTKAGAVSNASATKSATDVAAGAITDEDLALDLELKRMADETPPAFQIADGTPQLTKEEDTREMLHEFVDVKPANTRAELDEQVDLARIHGADSVEASDAVIRSLVGANYKEPYLMYKSVKVYKVGAAEASKANDRMTVEQKVFGRA